MNFTPLVEASPAIQFHVATVIPAAILGAYLLLARKGTRQHRLLGKIWLILMVLTAISSLFIHQIRMVGPFSPIHILSIGVIVSSWTTYRAARRHDVRAHRIAVSSMYIGGILGAGAFTLWPDRMLNAVFFSGSNQDYVRYGIIVAGLLVTGIYIWNSKAARQLTLQK